MEFVRTELRNGVRVIIAPMPGCPTVSFYIGAEVGLLNETRATNGVSHFLEHALFKGSRKWPDGQALLEHMDVVSIEQNAATSHEVTDYWMKGRADRAPEIVDVLTDLYVFPTLSEKGIENERSVIMGEIDMYEDTPESRSVQGICELIWGDQPAGWDILGTKENVQRFKRKNLLTWHQEHYTADSTFVVVAGGISAAEILRCLESSPLSQLRMSSRSHLARPRRATTSLSYKALEDDTNQTHISLGFDINSLQAGPLLGMLGSVLGGGMSSRIFRRMRNELGLGYYAHGVFDVSRSRGCYIASAGVDPGRTAEAVNELARLCTRMASECVTEKELSIAREMVLNRFVTETSGDMVGFLASREALGLPLALPEDYAKEVHHIRAVDVREAARQIFMTENLHIVVVGPHGIEEKDIV